MPDNKHTTPPDLLTFLKGIKDAPPEWIVDLVQGAELDHVGLACRDCAVGAIDAVLEALIDYVENAHG